MNMFVRTVATIVTASVLTNLITKRGPKVVEFAEKALGELRNRYEDLSREEEIAFPEEEDDS